MISDAKRSGKSRQRGFTLVEMMVVVAMIGILVSMAVPAYNNMVLRAKETVLKHNLYVLRDVIDQYYADRGQYPDSLQSLVSAGYLRSMPVDPILQASRWEEVPFTGYEENQLEPLDSEEMVGVFDVKSMAEGEGLNGQPYKEW